MWNIIQCAVTGQGHIEERCPCQDKTYILKECEFAIAVLADGAGSARLSHYGAEVVTRKLANHFMACFDEYYANPDGVNVKNSLVQFFQATLQEKAAELSCDLQDLASTLLLSAVKNDRYIIVHIGDGVIGYFKGGELRVASAPYNVEYSNTTVFTTSPNCSRFTTLLKGNLNGIEGFVLMSDGAGTCLYHKQSQTFSEGLKRIEYMLSYVPSVIIEKQLQSSFLEVIREKTNDDCSIVMMVQDNVRFPGYTQLSLYDKVNLLQLHVSRAQMKRCLSRYDVLLYLLESPKNIICISRKLYLKPKYTAKYLKRLLHLNFIEKKDGKYQTILRL